jgi:hypothetical protein
VLTGLTVLPVPAREGASAGVRPHHDCRGWCQCTRQLPCRPLASDLRRIHGRFKLVNPVTKVAAGHVNITIEWAQVLHPVRPPRPHRTAPPESSYMPLDDVPSLNDQRLSSGETVIEISVLNAAVQVRNSALRDDECTCFTPTVVYDYVASTYL